jgi:hypothetical protein
MHVLIACEFSGIVRESFKAKGHDAWSCDLLPSEIPGNHIIGNVLDHLDDNWDLMIAHPPCTYLANSGVQHLHKDPKRFGLMKKARSFFMQLYYADIPKIAIENPLPSHYANLPRYKQIIQPWMFGQEYQKRTCLWLKNIDPLEPTKIVGKGENYIGKNGKSNGSLWYQTLRMKDRQKNRSRTFTGIANAMAQQWG